MAQTFPMALADFFSTLPIQGFAPDLGESMEFSRTKGGEITTSDNGPRLWMMNIIIGERPHASIEQIKARLNLLRSPNRSLLVPSMPLLAPQKDPLGSILGSSVVTLTAVASNNREITLEGLPPGYTLSIGDFLSFTYGSNPVRYAMHQVVAEKSADGAGILAALEVVDFIRPGWTAGAVVTLVKAFYKAVVVPRSTEVGDSDVLMSKGVKFSVIQTFR